MFFDIDEIQIQVGVLFNNEKCIVVNSSSPQNYFEDIYISNKYIKKNIYIYIYIRKINTKTKFKKVRLQVSIFSDFVGSQISIDNIFPG